MSIYVHKSSSFSVLFFSDISALSSLHHLLELDCSHNQLKECLALDPAPRNLRKADCSFNSIEVIPDLSVFECLESLNLDSILFLNSAPETVRIAVLSTCFIMITCMLSLTPFISDNNISVMQGISNCKRLKYLSIAHNKLKKMQGMTDLKLRHLCLVSGVLNMQVIVWKRNSSFTMTSILQKYNELTGIENLETLTLLQSIDLSGNKIRSLLGLEKHHVLEVIDMESNEVDLHVHTNPQWPSTPAQVTVTAASYNYLLLYCAVDY